MGTFLVVLGLSCFDPRRSEASRQSRRDTGALIETQILRCSCDGVLGVDSGGLAPCACCVGHSPSLDFTPEVLCTAVSTCQSLSGVATIMDSNLRTWRCFFHASPRLGSLSCG